MITKYGYDVFFTVSIVCLLAVVLSLVFVEPKILKYCIVAVSIVLLGLTVNFFRDPERTSPAGENLVLSPADGKIIAIRQLEEKEFLGSGATMISVFMSPLNVHVNRNPISGTVKHLRYVKGEYFAAYEDKASEKNEQMVIGIEGPHGRVLFKQIAGFVARRIVCTLKMDDTVKAGERFGMIKFGSRVDVFVTATALVRAKVGDETVAGETVLAEFRQ
ncbi:MAG: phosphatidylserine decarboxylase family protein [Ignavibacteriales bacterium]|nr:phosphatidylserine decarboxylase family protein [Ignavibacteriales bacterium]